MPIYLDTLTVEKHSVYFQYANQVSYSAKGVNMFWNQKDRYVNMEHMIVLKENAFNVIKRAKGWKTDAELARHLDFTRQYICSLKKRKTPCTHDVIVRIATILADTDGNWWNHFEIIKVGKYDPDHQKWNQLKHKGKQPYTKYSIMANMRSQDGVVEKRG